MVKQIGSLASWISLMDQESGIQSINPKIDVKDHGHESVGESSRKVPKDCRHGKMIPA